MNNAITYQGIVNLKVKSGANIYEKTLHNNGKADLFKIITKALAGYDITKEIPSDVVLSITNNSEKFSTKPSRLTARVYRSHTSDTPSDEAWELSTTAALPYSGDVIGAIDATSTAELVLLNRQGVALASVNFTAEDTQSIFKISEGMQVLIEWNLVFENKVVGGSN